MDGACRSVDGISPGQWLRITSPCPGSWPRLAAPKSLPARASETQESPVEGPIWDGFCAVCKRPISIEGSEPPPSALRDSAKRSRTQALLETPGAALPLSPDTSLPEETQGKRFAYVIALWGSSPEYVLGAMVLAWSLRRTGTRHDLVLVHTDDVTSPALELLKRAGWKARLVEHVSASPALSNDGCLSMRFAKVFTKLRVLELVEYSKILMMDIDLLVRQNIDDIFDLEAPAAMVRGPEVGYKHGERVDGTRFFAGSRVDGYSWGQASGINAGTMLLQPDLEVAKHMVAEVRDDFHPSHVRGNGPEQDYLSRFFADKWRHVSVAYNFQLHHMYFALSPASFSTSDRTEFILHPERIKVIHYSSEPKPWSRLLEDQYAEFTDETWLSEILNSFSGYRAWVLGDEDCMRKEARVNGAAIGPDGKIHYIDWEQVKRNSEQRYLSWKGAGKWGASAEADDKELSGITVKMAGTDVVDHPDNPSNGTGMVSDDGYPLGKALEVSQEGVAAAEKALKETQDLWFGAYKDLASDLGETNLADKVKAASTGPLIREEWDWSTGTSKEQVPDSSTWTREDTGGWWVQGPLGNRFVATASLLPQKQVTLSVAGSVLLTSCSQGVHAAAVSQTGAACPAAFSFSCDSSSLDDVVAAATKWAEAVPHRAMVLLGVLDISLDQSSTVAILEALSSAGLGCPRSMPPKPTDLDDSNHVSEENKTSGSFFPVAAALGRKGDSRWYTTHAAAETALATCVFPVDASTVGTAGGG